MRESTAYHKPLAEIISEYEDQVTETDKKNKTEKKLGPVYWQLLNRKKEVNNLSLQSTLSAYLVFFIFVAL